MTVHGHPRQTRRSPRRAILAAAAALAVLVAALLLLLLPSSPSKHRRPLIPRSQPRLFAPDSIWNRRLSANAAIAPSSPQLVAHLVSQVGSEESAGVGPWIAAEDGSTTIYTVPANAPTVHVDLIDPHLAWRASLARAFQKVPIPAGAHPAKGPDEEMTIWQPSSNKLWEFYRAKHTTRGWQAAWGGAMQNVSHNPGYYTPAAWPGAQDNWGATATSFPVAAGVILLSEIRAGAIHHALALDLPGTRAGVLATPAERSDGYARSDVSIPEGAHLRINPRVDLSRLPMPPLIRMIAVAAQRYGMIVRDKAPGISLFIEAPTRHAGKVRQQLYGNRLPDQLLAHFPWRDLEVLRMHLRRTARPTGFLEHH